MTKAEIINQIAEQTGVAKKDVATTVEAFMETIRISLAENTTMMLDARDIPSFKPAKNFMEKML